MSVCMYECTVCVFFCAPVVHLPGEGGGEGGVIWRDTNNTNFLKTFDEREVWVNK